jgi:hypothetical protein
VPAGLEASVNVLTQGFWPSYPFLEVRLPEEIAQVQAVFQEYYLAKHSGRALQWYNSLGQCIMKAKFDSGYKELQVSLTQVRGGERGRGATDLHVLAKSPPLVSLDDPCSPFSTLGISMIFFFVFYSLKHFFFSPLLPETTSYIYTVRGSQPV